MYYEYVYICTYLRPIHIFNMYKGKYNNKCNGNIQHKNVTRIADLMDMDKLYIVSIQSTFDIRSI